MVGPLSKDSWKRIKEVARYTCLRDPKGVGHVFTDKTRRKLKIGGGEFLVPKEESKFREVLEQHGKAFSFSPQEIGCVDPNACGTNCHLNNTPCTMEHEADSCPKSSHSKIVGAIEGKY